MRCFWLRIARVETEVLQVRPSLCWGDDRRSLRLWFFGLHYAETLVFESPIKSGNECGGNAWQYAVRLLNSRIVNISFWADLDSSRALRIYFSFQE